MTNFILNPQHILFEDNHLLIVNKPAGVLSQGDKTGDSSLVDAAKTYIGKKYNKPGNVYLGLPHRLDRPVSGAIICCRTSKALERVNKMIKTRQIEKVYHAICLAKPPNKNGLIVSYLKKDRIKNKVSSYQEPVEGSKRAELEYSLRGRAGVDGFLLEVRLITGRPHQIRVQLNDIKCPILGDMKYFQQEPLPDKSIALHARKLKFEHPVGNKDMEIVAPYPDHYWWNI